MKTTTNKTGTWTVAHLEHEDCRRCARLVDEALASTLGWGRRRDTLTMAKDGHKATITKETTK